MNIAFVPARCGSKSIPLKNIKIFCKKPLIYWSLKALDEAKYIDKIYVATDCDEIKDVVSSFDFSKVCLYDRDKKNASDIASTESVMLEFINKYNFYDSDKFVLAQVTSPLTQSVHFDDAIKQFENEKADSLLSCTRVKHFFWSNDCKPINYDFKNRPRRQDFDGVYVENGAFYISSIKNIKRYKNRLSGKISIYEMPKYTFVEIDEEYDWIIAEQLMYRYVLG